MAGLLSSLLGGDNSTPNYNADDLKKIVKKGADDQTNLVNGVQPKLASNTSAYQTSIDGAQQAADTARQANNNAFLNSLKSKETTLNNDTFNTGKQKILQSVQPAQDAIRETLAGSGVGLQGGAAVKQLSQPVLQANSQVNDLANSVTQDAQKADIGAQTTLQGQDNSAILNNLGIDTNTYNTIMSSNRQDLKDELNQLLGISQQSTADNLGIEQNQFTNNLASASADNQSRNQMISSLLGAAGTIGGASIAAGARK